MTHPLEIRLSAMEDARKHGVNAASRRYKIAASTLSGWIKEADEAPPVSTVMPAVREAEVVDGLEHVEGLPARGNRAYIDPANITRAVDLAHLYSARRRADLRIELAEAAVVLAERLSSGLVAAVDKYGKVTRDDDGNVVMVAMDGRDAQGYATALSKVVEALRLESGQVSSLKGVVDIRQQLDEEQRAAEPVKDLTVAIEATSVPIEDVDAEV